MRIRQRPDADPWWWRAVGSPLWRRTRSGRSWLRAAGPGPGLGLWRAFRATPPQFRAHLTRAGDGYGSRTRREEMLGLLWSPARAAAFRRISLRPLCLGAALHAERAGLDPVGYALFRDALGLTMLPWSACRRRMVDAWLSSGLSPSEVAALSASLRALGVGHSPIDAIRFAWDGSGSPAHLPLPPRGAAVHEWVTLWAAAMARNPRALERAGEWARRFGADAPHWAATGMDPAEADAARAAGELDLASVRAMAFLLPGGAPSR